MFFTKSHSAALEAILSMGELYFSRQASLPNLKPRLFPLLIGPTGTGKSFLVEHASTLLKADYFRVQRGDWIPQGCKAGRPTMHQILDRLMEFPRCVLHLDELDKQSVGPASGNDGDWGASISSDLWRVLDLKFNVPEYLREANFADPKPVVADVVNRIPNLWIVGSGTWQHVFERYQPGATMGFSKTDGAQRSVDLQEIAASKMISPELLYRFSSDAIFLEYPSLEETEHLLKITGIKALARELSLKVGAEHIKWEQGGIRVLETLGTKLALAKHRRDRNRKPAPIVNLPLPPLKEPTGP